LDDKHLIKLAMDAAWNSYSPYSNFSVGAAVLTGRGKVYTGCNIENASIGATVCAERVAILKAVSEGDSDIKAIAIAASDFDDFIYPCGICRQVIAEFCDENTTIICSKNGQEFKEHTVKEMLPYAFRLKDE